MKPRQLVLVTTLIVLAALLLSCQPAQLAQPSEASDQEIISALRNLPTDQLTLIISSGEQEQQEFQAEKPNKWQTPFPIGEITPPLERVLPLAKEIYAERGGTWPLPPGSLPSHTSVSASTPAPASSTLPISATAPIASTPAPESSTPPIPATTPIPSSPLTSAEETTPDPQARFFTHTIDEVRKETVSITTKNFDTNFEERTATYDAYFIPGETFRIICQQPCPIEENILKQKVVGADAAIRALIDLTQIDVLPILEPVDIHLTSSVECGNYQEKLQRNGYVSRFSGGRPQGVPSVTPGSYMCLWEYDDEQLILPLNEENALRIEAQGVLVHEYAHILFYRRSFASPEGFVQALQLYVSGAWDGEARGRTNFPRMTDACNPELERRVTDVYLLCSRCGFQMHDFRTVLQQVSDLYTREAGEAIEGKVSIPQLKQIIDDITGRDSVSECGVDWLGDAG